MMSTTIDFLVGGRSTERDASLHSYYNVIACLATEAPADLGVANVWYLAGDGCAIPHNHADVSALPRDEESLSSGTKVSLVEMLCRLRECEYVYSLLHGDEGEDGCFQGISEVLDIPGNFGAVHASAVAMHKWTQTLLAEACASEILTPLPTLLVALPPSERDIERILESFCNEAIVVKPNRLGASLLAAPLSSPTRHEVREILAAIAPYDDHAVVQKRIFGREFTCGVLRKPDGVVALPIVEIATDRNFCGNEEKRTGRVKSWISTATSRADTLLFERIEAGSMQIFSTMGFSDMCRVDVIVDQSNRIFFLEANALPGLIRNGWFTMMLDAASIRISDLLRFSVENYQRRRIRLKELRYSIKK